MSGRGDIMRAAAFRARECGTNASGDVRMACFAAADGLEGLAEVVDAMGEQPRRDPKDMMQLASVPPDDQPDLPSEPVLVDPNYVASVKPSSVGSRLTMLNGERIYVINRTPEVCALWTAMRS